MAELKIKNSIESIIVNNIFCIGKNYPEHIREMNPSSVTEDLPSLPVVFIKPNSALKLINNKVHIPKFNSVPISSDLQNEVELVVVIGHDGINIPETDAMNFVLGYAVGIDFTLRDLQFQSKLKGLPWTVSKGFISSAPVSDVIPSSDIMNPHLLDIKLYINNQLIQSANTSQMIFKIPFIIHYLSCIFGIKKGDLVFTGTPAGVMTLKSGDLVSAEIQNIGKLNVTVA